MQWYCSQNLQEPMLVFDDPVIEARVDAEQEHRRRDERTYTAPLQSAPDMVYFLRDFYQNAYSLPKQDFYQSELAKYPSVNAHYEQLVRRGKIRQEDFWQRYEYRCDPNRISREIQEEEAENEPTWAESVVKIGPETVSKHAAGLEIEGLSSNSVGASSSSSSSRFLEEKKMGSSWDDKLDLIHTSCSSASCSEDSAEIVERSNRGVKRTKKKAEKWKERLRQKRNPCNEYDDRNLELSMSSSHESMIDNESDFHAAEGNGVASSKRKKPRTSGKAQKWKERLALKRAERTSTSEILQLADSSSTASDHYQDLFLEPDDSAHSYHSATELPPKASRSESEIIGEYSGLISREGSFCGLNKESSHCSSICEGTNSSGNVMVESEPRQSNYNNDRSEGESIEWECINYSETKRLEQEKIRNGKDYGNVPAKFTEPTKASGHDSKPRGRLEHKPSKPLAANQLFEAKCTANISEDNLSTEILSNDLATKYHELMEKENDGRGQISNFDLAANGKSDCVKDRTREAAQSCNHLFNTGTRGDEMTERKQEINFSVYVDDNKGTRDNCDCRVLCSIM